MVGTRIKDFAGANLTINRSASAYRNMSEHRRTQMGRTKILLNCENVVLGRVKILFSRVEVGFAR